MLFTKPIRVTWKKAIRELSPDNNIFIKNIHPNVTEADLEKAFAIYGSIFSSKLSLDEHGKNRGYGYIQFEDEIAAKKALNSPPLVFFGQTVECLSF